MILGFAEFAFVSKRSRGIFLVLEALLGNYLLHLVMDPIGNMLTNILNAQRVGKARIVIPHSRFKESLALMLRAKGLVAKVAVQEGEKAALVVTLAYDDQGQPVISGIKRLSKPGRRLYARKSDIPYALAGSGAIILSTSHGLMDDIQARETGLGGELVCEIW